MYTVILCTTPISESEKIAKSLVEEGLVACVNIPQVNSYFRWEGEIQVEKEALLIMKTRTAKIEQIVERIKELHSYEVPEIIALPIIAGHEGYLDWVGESVK